MDTCGFLGGREAMKKPKASAARKAIPFVEARQLPGRSKRRSLRQPGSRRVRLQHRIHAAGRSPSSCDGALLILSADAQARRLFGHAVAEHLTQSGLMDLLRAPEESIAEALG